MKDMTISTPMNGGHEKGPAVPLETDLAVPAPTPAFSVDDIPDGGYGWVCVACVGTINAFVWGVAASYGVYLSHYLSANTFVGARPLDFALVGGLNFAIAMAIAPLVTNINRILGTRPTMLIGVVLHALGFITASFADGRIWVLFLTQGMLIGIGISFMFIPSVAVLPQWFWKKRTLAQGMSSAGSGIGGIIFSVGTDAMIRGISLEWALRITGIICLCCNFAATLFLRDRNATVKPSQLGFAVYLLKRYDVILLLTYSFINMFGYMTVLYSISDYGLSLGLTQQQASIATTVLNLGTFLGRPIIGFASDRLGRIKIAGFGALTTGLFCFIVWIPCNSYGVLIFFALFVGAIVGTFWMTIGPLAAEVAGLKEVPSLLSLSWISIILPTAFAEVIALYLRRPGAARPYLYPQLFAALSFCVSSLFLAELWRVKRKQKRQGILTELG